MISAKQEKDETTQVVEKKTKTITSFRLQRILGLIVVLLLLVVAVFLSLMIGAKSHFPLVSSGKRFFRRLTVMTTRLFKRLVCLAQ